MIVKTRFREHVTHLRNGRSGKPCVTLNVVYNNHYVENRCSPLVKHVKNNCYLDAQESLEISIHNNLMKSGIFVCYILG